ncbi:hypothetical protein H2200_007374 [Cladophialophora chaetospira]|uniref:Uncharacterized protein n=1 Tax=Cladophialophora chaetospira TaxID=386627 RepID=A0AA38X874_9EURO|nr:hypothetical protein H2200_007374 [Cladophialophora chaetospira]
MPISALSPEPDLTHLKMLLEFLGLSRTQASKRRVLPVEYPRVTRLSLSTEKGAHRGTVPPSRTFYMLMIRSPHEYRGDILETFEAFRKVLNCEILNQQRLNPYKEVFLDVEYVDDEQMLRDVVRGDRTTALGQVRQVQ